MISVPAVQGRHVGLQQIQLNRGSQFARGLVGWWPMGNQACWGTKTLLDMSLHGNDGTLANMDAATDYTFDGRPALDFDGSNDHVGLGAKLNAIINSGSELTVTAWVYARTRPIWATIVKSWGNTAGQVHLGLQTGDGDVSVYVDTTAGQIGPVREGSGTPLPLNEWHLISCVANGVDLRLFRNGIEVGTPLASTADFDGAENWNIGLKSNNVQPWDGMIDDVRIYRRGLSAGHIIQMYHETLDGSYGSLAQPQARFFRGMEKLTAAGTGAGAVLSRRKPVKKVGPQQISLNRGSQFAKGLVGWWPMGNQACWGSDTLLDASLYSNDGTLNGMDPATDYTLDERPGLEFDASNDYVQASDAALPSGNNAYSWSVWTYYRGGGSTPKIINWGQFSSSDMVGIGIDSGTGQVEVDHHSNDWSSSYSMPTNQWVHLSGSYDPSGGGTERVYSFGEFRDSRSTLSITVAKDKIRFGASTKGATHNWYPGTIDDIRIYNRVFSAAEHAQLYQETRDGSYGSLAQPQPRFFPANVGAAAAGGGVVSMIGEGGMIGYGGMISRGGGIIS